MIPFYFNNYNTTLWYEEIFNGYDS